MEATTNPATIDEASYPPLPPAKAEAVGNHSAATRLSSLGRYALSGISVGLDKLSNLRERIRTRKIDTAVGDVATCECAECHCSPCACGNTECTCS